MKKHIRIIFTLLVFLITYSCSGPATLITGSWLNKQGFEGKNYKSVFIAALTQNLEVKGAVEEAFAQEAAKRSITSVKSIDFFKPTSMSGGNTPPDREEILNRIRATKSEAILTVNLKDSKSDTRYVPGSTSYEPVQSNNYYNNFYGYYKTAYAEVYTEGYYTTDRIYFIECNLYDAATEELLWSAQSKTTNPKNIDKFAKEYAALIVERLRSDRLVPQQ
jgi:hypothetical protein